jgi:hypothetical protein
MTQIRNNDAARFAMAYRIADGGCWLWKKALRRDGYGNFFIGPKCWLAHRYAWTQAYGDIPAGAQLNHRCHNRACVNPAHIYIGTQAQNMRDMVDAGRSVGRKRKGEENQASKLKENDVRVIRASQLSCVAIARAFDVSPSLISAIRLNKIWKHVTPGTGGTG